MLLLAQMQGRFPLFIDYLSDAAGTGRLVAKAWAISGWPLLDFAHFLGKE